MTEADSGREIVTPGTHRMEPRSDHHAYLTDHHQLFGSTNEQYVIPTYQRRYSWHERQVCGADRRYSVDRRGRHAPARQHRVWPDTTRQDWNRLELVDGQQRLTTVTIILECIRQRMELDGEADEAAEVARLLSAKPSGAKRSRKGGARLDRLGGVRSAGAEQPAAAIPEPATGGRVRNRSGLDRRGLEELGRFSIA